MSRIVAIDFGVKRLGLAITDENQKMALPFCVVQGGSSLSKVTQNVLKALANHLPQIEMIVVGLPLLMNGKKGKMALLVEQFCETLQKSTSFPIISLDERLTSMEADRLLKTMNHSRKERSQRVDVTSAVIILQTYLDQKHEPL